MLAAGKRVEMPRLNLVHQFRRLSLCGNQIEPAARDHQTGRQTEHAISDGIAMVMVVEKPAVDVPFAQCSLDGGQVHGQTSIVNKAEAFERIAEATARQTPPNYTRQPTVRPRPFGCARESARMRFFIVPGSVSHAVRCTRRGARLRIFIKYGTVRLGSNFAVSRSSQPRPFCTMSSSSARSELESFVISGKNIFARVPQIRAAHAARRCQRFRDFAQRNTFFTRSGLDATMGAIRSCTKASWSAQLLMRSSQDSSSLNSRSPNSASSFSKRNTAVIFSSRTLPEKSSSATLTTKSSPNSFRISRRKLRAARRRSAVYQPCDLISSLKNHCTPAACSGDPPCFSVWRICAAISAGVGLREGREFNWLGSPRGLSHTCQKSTAAQLLLGPRR